MAILWLPSDKMTRPILPCNIETLDRCFSWLLHNSALLNRPCFWVKVFLMFGIVRATRANV